MPIARSRKSRRARFAPLVSHGFLFLSLTLAALCEPEPGGDTVEVSS
jgi:hypothetical protein